jgi:3-methyladenine DNA glycosylase/8-oxoguanine DNA glycosylase
MAASGSRPIPEIRATPDVHEDWAAPYRVDLTAVLGVFARGRRDPTIRLDGPGAWLTMRAPEGEATVHIRVTGETVAADAWGPGAQWAADSVPDLLGFHDDPSGFPAVALPQQLQPVWRRYADRWRVPRSRRVMEALVAAVFEQKVTGIESRRCWNGLLNGVGQPAPGPAPDGMRVFPPIDTIRQVPSWQWHRWGAQPPQSATVMRCVQVAGRLEQCTELDLGSARRRLAAVDGIGPWTVAEVGSRALGDPDAVSVGDYHLPGQLVYAFTGRTDGDDAAMAELLAPFAGHRHRVQRIVELSGITRPRRGPRMSASDNRHR